MNLNLTRRLAFCAVTMLACSLAGVSVFAAPAIQPAKKPSAKPQQRHQQIDHGPFVSATISPQWEEHGITNKAIAVRLTMTSADGKPILAADGKPQVGGVLFDTDTCRLAAGWTGGFIDFTKDWTSVRDSKSVKLVGTQIFGTSVGPGWAKASLYEPLGWTDVRPQGFGPLPADWMRYKGLYRHGNRVIFSYVIGQCPVLEMATLEMAGGLPVISRTFEIGKADHEIAICLAESRTLEKAEDRIQHNLIKNGLEGPRPFFEVDNPAGGPGSMLRIFYRGTPHRPQASIDKWTGPHAGRKQSRLTLPAIATPMRLKLSYVDITRTEDETAVQRELQPPEDLTALIKGGPALWPEIITTAGKLGEPKADAPYVVDTLTLPDDNPWKSWMRPSGFDFFTSDPTKAAICNWSGDVWVVSGIAGDLKELKWRRIASGLFQPLGLRIVKDQIYVLGRDQVTRLVDLNGDGETDFYECFNNDVQVTPNFHEFAFDLQTDQEGNFYFSKGGPVKNGGNGFETIADQHGAIMKLSPDGKTLATYATGLRAPNGIGIGPDGQITAGDNEGSWVPKCRLAWVKPGGFYGVVPTSHRSPLPTDYDRPLCWFPKSVDNSSGGQVWAISKQWGPFENRLLHLSYGTCSLFLVMKEDIATGAMPNAAVQGGVVRFPLSFDSGIMRARFNSADGQLYVAGLKGWQTSAGKDGCFQRVRYTGKPVNMPTDIRATKSGLAITFTAPLDQADGNDAESFSIERWNYIWKDAYGSPDISVNDPTKQTHDTVKISSAKLSPDGKTVFLAIPEMKPAMQYKTEVNLTSATGADLKFEIYHTVHVLQGE